MTSSELVCNDSAFSQPITSEPGESADRLGRQLAVDTEVGRYCTDVVRRWRARRRPGNHRCNVNNVLRTAHCGGRSLILRSRRLSTLTWRSDNAHIVQR